MLDLNDKTLLVSITRIDNEGQETNDTFFGTVAAYNSNTVTVTRPDGRELNLPYDEEVYEAAEPGFYELRDGSTFENPDFIAQWTVYASQAAADRFRAQHQDAQ